MPLKKYYKPKPKKEKEIKERWDAVKWLEWHPEDIPLARDNLNARDRGYDNDAVRNLMAAICLRTCADYKIVTSGKSATKIGDPELVKEDCHKFFGSDMFQFFINRMNVEDIENHIKNTPSDAITAILKKLN